MFKTKHPYLKAFDVMWDFDLAEWNGNILKSMQHLCTHCTYQGSQYKSHSHCWPSCSLVMMLSIPRCWEGICVLKSLLKPIVLFKVHFVSFSVFVLWLTQGWTFSQAVNPLKWYRHFSETGSPVPLGFSFLCSSCGQSFPTFFAQFQKCITLAHHASFWGLLTRNQKVVVFVNK